MRPVLGCRRTLALGQCAGVEVLNQSRSSRSFRIADMEAPRFRIGLNVESASTVGSGATTRLPTGGPPARPGAHPLLVGVGCLERHDPPDLQSSACAPSRRRFPRSGRASMRLPSRFARGCAALGATYDIRCDGLRFADDAIVHVDDVDGSTMTGETPKALRGPGVPSAVHIEALRGLTHATDSPRTP